MGNIVSWRGIKLGKLTQWGANISYQCSLHRSCKTPAIAAQHFRCDDDLIAWLLGSIDRDGAVELSQEEHMQQGKLFKQQCQEQGPRCLFCFGCIGLCYALFES